MPLMPTDVDVMYDIRRSTAGTYPNIGAGGVLAATPVGQTRVVGPSIYVPSGTSGSLTAPAAAHSANLTMFATLQVAAYTSAVNRSVVSDRNGNFARIWFRFGATGTVEVLRGDGVGLSQSTSAVVTAPVNVPVRWECTVRADNTCTVRWSSNLGVTWTVVTMPNFTRAGIWNGSAPWLMGGGTADGLGGELLELRLRNDDTGAVVFAHDAASVPAVSSATSFTAKTGQTVTINRVAPAAGAGQTVVVVPAGRAVSINNNPATIGNQITTLDAAVWDAAAGQTIVLAAVLTIGNNPVTELACVTIGDPAGATASGIRLVQRTTEVMLAQARDSVGGTQASVQSSWTTTALQRAAYLVVVDQQAALIRLTRVLESGVIDRSTATLPTFGAFTPTIGLGANHRINGSLEYVVYDRPAVYDATAWESFAADLLAARPTVVIPDGDRTVTTRPPRRISA